ncbi:MAG: response regulator transcription factor [Gemmatimonadaceae bacterium]|nr:response regulator transcription factor [Gemmatimonadaceae bacterium]
MKALVVEDDHGLAMVTRRMLERAGFVVDVSVSAEEGQTMAFMVEYDLMVLDLGLPDRNGVTVVQALRRAGNNVPILVLTGSLDSETTVRALDAGADDYLTKPIKMEEFDARIRALVRRGGAQRTELLAMGNVVLNRLSRQLMVSGLELRLTAKEFLLLEHLMLNAAELVSRSKLLDKVWETNFDPGTNVVDVNVSRLRKKLRAANAGIHIESRRGMGFTISARSDEAST